MFEAITAFAELSSSINIDPGKPAGTNDSTKLLVAVLTNDRFAVDAGFTAPAGWTAPFTPPDMQMDVGALTVFTAPGDVASTVFTRVGVSGGNGLIGAILRFDGRNVSSPHGAMARLPDTTQTVTVPSLTALLNDDAVYAWSSTQNNTAWGAGPAGMTSRGGNPGTVSSPMLVIATADALAAGTFAAQSWEHPSNFIPKGAFGLLLKAAGGGGGGNAARAAQHQRRRR